MKRVLLGLALATGFLAMPLSAGAERYVVTVSNFVFTPADVSGLTGDQFVWTWTGGLHTVTEDTGLFDSGPHMQPFRFRRVFNTPGDYFYHCSIHGGVGGIGQSGVVRVSSRDFDDEEEDDGERPQPQMIRP